MRYTLTQKSRQPVIIAALLIGAGALAAAAAHVGRGATVRGDVLLVEPLQPKAAPSRTAADVRPEGLLFGGSARRSSGLGPLGNAPGLTVAAANRDAAAERFSGGAYESRYTDTGYRDFAGERRRNASGGGGGSRSSASVGGGGGSVGGGGGWGGSSSGSQTQSSSGSSSGGNATAGGGQGGAASSGPDPFFQDNTGAPGRGRAGGAVAASLAGALGNSPGAAPTPEPLTLFLVASGLAGIYGARKHLV